MKHTFYACKLALFAHSSLGSCVYTAPDEAFPTTPKPKPTKPARTTLRPKPTKPKPTKPAPTKPAATTLPLVWITRDRKHCAGKNNHGVKYDSYAEAKAACDSLGEHKCSGVYDKKCDMKNEFYTCKYHAVEEHSLFPDDCVYTRPCPKTKGTATKKHGRSLCHEDGPIAVKRWVDVGSKVVCDQGAGEVFLTSSSGKVSSLDQCKQSCHDAAQCKSITYFRSRYCSHFSTSCANTKRNGKAAGSYHLSAEPATTKPPATTRNPSRSKRSWTSAVSNTQCDTGAGEVFLGSPGKVSSLDTCKKSCEDSGDCQSITYFKNGYCSLFSTPCTKTKNKRKAVVLQFIEKSTAPAVTRPPIRWVEVGSKVVCDTAAYLDNSPGKTSNSGACKSLCEANPKCNGITYFNSGWCSHFTSCTKTKKHKKAFKSFRVTTARRNLRAGK